jgi:RNA polymerase sigma-70 factor (ECF subfamily)
LILFPITLLWVSTTSAGEIKLEDAPGDITQLLQDVKLGKAGAESELVALVYRELHNIANRLMRAERPDHTLQPTALVNEAYLRLVTINHQNWQNRAHFFAVAAQIMRRILVDYARAHRSNKRGGSLQRVDLDLPLAQAEDSCEELIAIDESLTRLASWDPRQSRIVELKFFVGLSEEDIAETLQVSSRTVRREWKIARAWLYGELNTEALNAPNP